MRVDKFLTSKIFKHKRYKKSISSPILKISKFSVVISVIVMLIAISTGFGIQNEIKSKFSNLFGDASISQYGSEFFNTSENIDDNKIEIEKIKNIDEYYSVNKVIYSNAIIPNKTSFSPIVLKGVEKSNPIFSEFGIKSDSLKNNQAFISKTLGNLLGVNRGDKIKVFFYHSDKNPIIRSVEILDVYETGIKEFDDKFLVTDIEFLRKVNKWDQNSFGIVEIQYTSFNNEIYNYIDPQYSLTINQDKFSEIYNWISLFDTNIYIVIILMILVSGINMITVLLITILDKTNFIGTVKILGANNKMVRKIFIRNGMSLVFNGLIIGNVVGLLVLFLQKNYKIVSLDASTYYINYVPIDLNILYILLLNIFIIISCFIFLQIPLRFISKIKPNRALKMN